MRWRKTHLKISTHQATKSNDIQCFCSFCLNSHLCYSVFKDHVPRYTRYLVFSYLTSPIGPSRDHRWTQASEVSCSCLRQVPWTDQRSAFQARDMSQGWTKNFDDSTAQLNGDHFGKGWNPHQNAELGMIYYWVYISNIFASQLNVYLHKPLFCQS